jgi:hypothetical protein
MGGTVQGGWGMNRLTEWIIVKLGGYTEREHNQLRIESVNNKLRADYAEKELKGIVTLVNETPEDCKRGVWCRDCTFSRRVGYRLGEAPIYQFDHTIVCERAGICKNYERRGEE